MPTYTNELNVEKVILDKLNQGNTISPARSVGSITSDYAIYLSGTSIGNIFTQNDMSVGAENNKY